MNQEVKIYTTPICPYCKMAKEFLSEKGVPFTAYDVSKDRKRLGCSTGVAGVFACGDVTC